MPGIDLDRPKRKSGEQVQIHDPVTLASPKDRLFAWGVAIVLVIIVAVIAIVVLK